MTTPNNQDRASKDTKRQGYTEGGIVEKTDVLVTGELKKSHDDELDSLTPGQRLKFGILVPFYTRMKFKDQQETGKLTKESAHPIYNKAVSDILSWHQSLLDQAVMRAFDDGYDSGRKSKPPKLIDAIEFRREQYGWNKSRMAAMLDMTKPNYSDFLAGRRGLPLNSVRKAYAIGIPAEVLLQDEIDARLGELERSQDVK